MSADACKIDAPLGSRHAPTANATAEVRQSHPTNRGDGDSIHVTEGVDRDDGGE